jgi:hypothetical protein
VLSAAERAYQIAPWHAMPTGLLAGVLARTASTAGSESLLREMGQAPKPTWGRVLYHLLTSDVGSAASWYERMIEERDPFAVVFPHALYCRALRASEHWHRLVDPMKLPAQPA